MQESQKIFNHLKIHTQYSICEGAAKIDDLQDYSKNSKLRSLGLCDTANLCGALEFSENSSAPHKFEVSHKPKDLILFFLEYSCKSSILAAPSQIEY